jgi:hypothetical protein
MPLKISSIPNHTAPHVSHPPPHPLPGRPSACSRRDLPTGNPASTSPSGSPPSAPPSSLQTKPSPAASAPMDRSHGPGPVGQPEAATPPHSRRASPSVPAVRVPAAAPPTCASHRRRRRRRPGRLATLSGSHRSSPQARVPALASVVLDWPQLGVSRRRHGRRAVGPWAG